MKKILIAVGLILIINGCASSWVKKPDFLSVKKIGIVSIYGNSILPRMDGKDSTSSWNDAVKLAVAEDMEKQFVAAFKGAGWGVTASSAFTASPEYASNFKPADVSKVLGVAEDSFAGRALSFVQKSREDSYLNSFFTPKGMWPISRISSELGTNSHTYHFGDAPKKPQTQAVLAGLAKKYNVDALALIQVRYCYKGGTWSSIGGMGAAYLHVTSTVQMIDKKGEVVVSMPEIQGSCGKDPIEIDRKLTMMGGQLFIGANIAGFNVESDSAIADVKDSFFAANLATAKQAVGMIREEMGKK